MKSQLTIAGVLFAALLATGCSQQQSSQQSTPEAAPAPAVEVAPAPAVVAPAPVVRPAPAAPVVPRIKAKGHYKGAVAMDANSRAALSQYQK
jgi:PBP1b-binding outer membrane lipoprotein LpoB